MKYDVSSFIASPPLSSPYTLYPNQGIRLAEVSPAAMPLIKSLLVSLYRIIPKNSLYCEFDTRMLLIIRYS
jgi:hypothetical protein